MQSNNSSADLETIEQLYPDLDGEYVVVNERKVDYLLASARSANHLAHEAFSELTNMISDLEELVVQLHRVSPEASKLLLDKLVILDDAWHDLDQSLSWDDVADLDALHNTTALEQHEVDELLSVFGGPDDGSGYNPRAERPLSIREQIAAADMAQPSTVPAPEDRLPILEDEDEDPHAEANAQLAKFGMAMQAGLGLDDLLVDERDEASDDEWAEQQLLLIPQNLPRPDLAAARLELIDYLTKREMAAVLKERMANTELTTHQRAYLSDERIRLLREAAADEARDIPAPTSAAEVQSRRNKEYVAGYDFSTEDPMDFTNGPPTEEAVRRSRNKVEEDRRKFAAAAVQYGYPAGSAPFEPAEPESRTKHPEHPGLDPEMARVHVGTDHLTGNTIYYAISLGVLDSPSGTIKATVSEGNIAYAHRDEFRHVPMGDLILRLWQQPVREIEIEAPTTEDKSDVQVVYKARSPLAREDVEVGEDGRSVLKDEYLIYTLLEPIGSDRVRRYYFRSTHPVPDPNLSNENHRLLAPTEIKNPSQDLVLRCAEHRDMMRPFIVSGDELGDLLGTHTASVVVPLSTAAQIILDTEGPQNAHVEELVQEAAVYSEDPLAEFYYNLYFNDGIQTIGDRPSYFGDHDESDLVVRPVEPVGSADLDDESDSSDMTTTVLEAYDNAKAVNANPEGEREPALWEVGDLMTPTTQYSPFKGQNGEVVDIYVGATGDTMYKVQFPKDGDLQREGHYREHEIALVTFAQSRRGDDIDAYFGAFTDVNSPEHYEQLPLDYDTPHFHEQYGEPVGFLESHEQDVNEDYDYGLYAPI